MGNDLTVHRKKEMDDFKKPMSMDEVIDMKMRPVVEAINSHNAKIYEDFNKAMMFQQQQIEKTETELSKMVQVLWGIVNSANARSAALENVLIRGGMNPDDLTAEIKVISDELTAGGDWVQQDLPSSEGPPPLDGSIPDPKHPESL